MNIKMPNISSGQARSSYFSLNTPEDTKILNVKHVCNMKNVMINKYHNWKTCSMTLMTHRSCYKEKQNEQNSFPWEFSLWFHPLFIDKSIWLIIFLAFSIQWLVRTSICSTTRHFFLFLFKYC